MFFYYFWNLLLFYLLSDARSANGPQQYLDTFTAVDVVATIAASIRPIPSQPSLFWLSRIFITVPPKNQHYKRTHIFKSVEHMSWFVQISRPLFTLIIYMPEKWHFHSPAQIDDAANERRRVRIWNGSFYEIALVFHLDCVALTCGFTNTIYECESQSKN